ncbi:MAG: methionyl-tRNA formyltransferase [Candidatus Dormibacteria bacterium]
MAALSEYLEHARRELWSRELFTFIPDRDLPPPAGTVDAGTGPRIVFAGFPSDYSLAFLLALLELDVRVAGIITSPGAHPAILGDNALSRIAAHLDVPLLRAWRINDEHSRMTLADMQPELVVMASFDQIIGARALVIPGHGWLNVHPSLLPQYRGPEPVYWAIADGAAQTGMTMHRAVPKVDTGPVMAQAAVVIDPRDNAGTLTRRIVTAGVPLLGDAVRAMLADQPGTPLDVEQGSYRPSVGHRDLRSAPSAAAAERMVRAGYPNMLAWADVDGVPCYVSAARRAGDGTISGHPVVTFPDGGLELTETSPTCGCHHNEADCPHRTVAGIATS